jgi:hypothetical protein
MLQVHHPDYDQIKMLLEIVKQKKLWRKHWGRAAFTVEQPESKSPHGKKTHHIQMVQAHKLVQLSMGAAKIGGVVDIDTHFTFRLAPDTKNKPWEPTVALVREVFKMMEVQKKKVWICLAKNANGSITGYFFQHSSRNQDCVQNFITCPVAQVCWWLQCRGA